MQFLFTFVHIFLTTKLVFNLIDPGEETCGNSTEIFTTETPSSLCSEVMMDAGGLSSLSTKILFFLDQSFTQFFQVGNNFCICVTRGDLEKEDAEVKTISNYKYKSLRRDLLPCLSTTNFLGHLEIHLRQLWNEVEVRHFNSLKKVSMLLFLLLMLLVTFKFNTFHMWKCCSRWSERFQMFF